MRALRDRKYRGCVAQLVKHQPGERVFEDMPGFPTSDRK